MECVKETGVPSEELFIVEVRDDGLYEITCGREHRSIIVPQQQKFEVLFEVGANAIVDGYYREAVSDFAGALERFYEFYLMVICQSCGIPHPTFREIWKTVAAQSERQLGAFIFVYATKTGKSPNVLCQKWTEFRNKVIHKGLIPLREDAIDFGQFVYDTISPLLIQLLSDHDAFVQNTVAQHLENITANAEAEGPIVTLSMPTILGIAPIGDIQNKDINKEIEALRQRRLGMGRQPGPHGGAYELHSGDKV